MGRQLVFLEAGVKACDALRLLPLRDGGASNTLLVSEEPLQLTPRSDLSYEIRCIDDYVPLSGTLDGQLFELASLLTEVWIARTRELRGGEVHVYDDLSLWEMGRLSQVYMIFRALRRIETVRTALRSAEWKAVHVLRNEDTFWLAFEWVASETGFSGEAKSILLARHEIRRNIKGRLFDLVAAGWGGEFLLDFRNGMRWFRAYESKKIGQHRQLHLCLVNGNGHYLYTMLPVIERLRSSSEVLVMNSGGDSCAEVLRKRRIRLSYCSQHVPFSALPRVTRQAKRLRESWSVIEKDDRLLGLLTYEGRSLWPVLHCELQRYAVHAFPRMMVWIESLRHIFQSAEPSTVLTVPDRHYPARIALALAQRYDVPSLTIQPALINDGPHYGPMYADRAAVIDEFSRQVFVGRGHIDPKRLVLTGLPRWDDIPRLMASATQQSAQSALREKLGLRREERLITFATENIALGLTRRMILAVAAVLPHHPDLRLVIKLHPAEALESYRQLVEDPIVSECRPLLTKDADLHALLASSELVIAWFSNVVLEAALLDRPVLVVNLSGEPDPLPFVEQGIALGAYAEDQVQEKLWRILHDPSTAAALRTSRQRYLELNPQLLDGRATERVAALVEEIAAGKGMLGQQGSGSRTAAP